MWYKEYLEMRVVLWLDFDLEPLLKVILVVLAHFFIWTTLKVLLGHARKTWIIGLQNTYKACWWAWWKFLDLRFNRIHPIRFGTWFIDLLGRYARGIKGDFQIIFWLWRDRQFPKCGQDEFFLRGRYPSYY